jgi:hypothetical protein
VGGAFLNQCFQERYDYATREAGIVMVWFWSACFPVLIFEQPHQAALGAGGLQFPE